MKVKRIVRAVRASLAAAVMLAVPVALAAPAARAVPAPNAKQLGVYKDWGFYSAPAGKGKMCFVVAQPKDAEPKNVSRDPVYFFVTSRPAEQVKNQPSVRSGYTYKDGAPITAEVGKESFTLFANGDGAWVRDTADEARLVNAMRKGATLVIKGTSKRGTHTTDTYSLAGFAQAMDRMPHECR